MVDHNAKLLADLQRKNGNDKCADCSALNPELASYNLGIFVCMRCSGIHRSMGVHISKVKHLKLDRWEDSQIQRMKDVGNSAAKEKYEHRVPPCYRIPKEHDPHVLVEQWIRAKYQREEFIKPEQQNYISGCMEGFLMKRGKEDSRYQLRKFVLSEADDTLKYYVKENREPKGILKISELNIAFAPQKIGHMNSMQISYMKDGSTRHIYVYHDDPEVIVNWYMAIRCAKLHQLQVAFPTASESELVCRLTRDFDREGWLWKKGPRPSDVYKRRWFSLYNRILMYHEEPLDAYPKGEIFLGYENEDSHKSKGYSAHKTDAAGCKDARFAFALSTPERTYTLAAPSAEERDAWLCALRRTVRRCLTPQDVSVAAQLVRKRTVSNSINIFSLR